MMGHAGIVSEGRIPDRGFPEIEYRSRLSAAQERMEKTGFDLLLLTTEPEVRYFTGFHTQFWMSPTRPWFLLVPRAGNPVAVIPGIGADCMANTWISDIRTWQSPQPDDEGISLLVETISELVGNGSVIGIQSGPESHLRMPFSDFVKLQSNLTNHSFADCNSLIRSLRIIKSELEIEKIRYACAIASAVFQNLGDIFRASMNEIDLFKAFKVACLEMGADDVAYLVGGADTGGYGDIISPPDQREIVSGDVLILDTGLVWDGYFCDFDRNYSIGRPSNEVSDAHKMLWDATQSGIEACVPGATCRDVFNAIAGHLPGNSSGVGRLGHGLGMQLTEHPSIAEFDETVLETDMVLTIEPGYEFAPGKIMVHEENLVVRKNGPELLSTRAAREISEL